MLPIRVSSLQSFISLFFCLALAGCSSKPYTDYDTGYDFTGVQRYQLESGVDEQQALMDPRIASAINAELQTRGLVTAENRANADVVVRYSLAAEEKPNSSRVSIGLGSGSYGGRGGASIGGSVSAPIGQSMLLYNVIRIDILDAGSEKLIWRGSDSFEVKGKADAEALSGATEAVVARILAGFPPDSATHSTIGATPTTTR